MRVTEISLRYVSCVKNPSTFLLFQILVLLFLSSVVYALPLEEGDSINDDDNTIVPRGVVCYVDDILCIFLDKVNYICPTLFISHRK